MKAFGVAAILFVCGGAFASAQDLEDGFGDGKNNTKVHSASGFVCPAKIGLFERDAVGAQDPEKGTDFCAYSALDGLYGTITLTPLKGPYSAKDSLAEEFVEQEGIGAHRLSEATVKTPGSPLGIYTRAYETTKLESLHYKMLFSGAAIGNWAVETTIEYADPRDNAAQKEFLNTVYASAEKQIASLPPLQVPVETPPVLMPNKVYVPVNPIPAAAAQPESKKH